MNFLFLGKMVGIFVYPVAVGVLSFWLSRRAFRTGSITLGYYVERGVFTAVVPPLLLVVGLALLAMPDYKGVCFVWMDRFPQTCGLVEYFTLQLFWSALLAFVPSLVGIGITIIIFLWTWVRHKKLQKPESTHWQGLEL